MGAQRKATAHNHYVISLLLAADVVDGWLKVVVIIVIVVVSGNGGGDSNGVYSAGGDNDADVCGGGMVEVVNHCSHSTLEDISL